MTTQNDIAQEARAQAAGLREAALQAGGALGVRLNQAAAVLEKLAQEPQEAPQALSSRIAVAMDALVEQEGRVHDASCTLKVVHAALIEPDDPATMASNAESALLLVCGLLDDIANKLDAATMAVRRELHVAEGQS